MIIVARCKAPVFDLPCACPHAVALMFLVVWRAVVSALKAIVGAWLRGLGASAYYYLVAGVLMLACGVLLLKRYALALAA